MEQNYIEITNKINSLQGKQVLIPFGSVGRFSSKDIYAVGIFDSFDFNTKTLYTKNTVGRDGKEYTTFKKPLSMFSLEEIYHLIKDVDQYFIDKYNNSKFSKEQNTTYKLGDKIKVMITSKTPTYKIVLSIVGHHYLLVVSEPIYEKLKHTNMRNFSCTLVDIKDIVK